MTRPTISDVAQVAKVSTGTVSRVLNNSPRVSPQARAAVQLAVEQTGYRANAHARSLATAEAHAIAVLIATPGNQVFSDPTFAQLIDGVQEGMRESTLNMVMLLGGTAAEDQRTLSYLLAGHVDGVVHLNPTLNDDILPGLAGSGLPVVLCGPKPPIAVPERTWSISIDDASGVRLAMQHLQSRGARRTAMITGPSSGVSAQVRLDTYRDVIQAAFDPQLVREGDYSTPSGYLAMKDLLTKRPDIDSVMCSSDRMAAGALTAAREAGRRVPHDLLVMGFDDHEIASQTTPALSTVRQPIHTIGQMAVSSLLAALAGATPADRTFPTELVVREST